MIFQNFQPKEKLQSHVNGGGSLARFRGPSLALQHFPKDCSRGWHTGTEWGHSELKVQDILSRAEIPKLCKSFTSSTEPAWGQPTEVGNYIPPPDKIHVLQTSQANDNRIVPTYKPISSLRSSRTQTGASRADKTQT